MNSFRTYRTLAPAAALYSAAQQIRNILYDHGILRSESFPVPVICVGNITVGGTGKTPMIQHLIELLKDQYKVAVLSRGYRRATSGYLLAGPTTTQPEIGDEPFQMHLRYPDVSVAVSEKRAIGIRNLLESVRPDVILLDDAFQHRAVRPSLSIVLTDYSRNMLDDAVIPAGRLRERVSGASRSDIIVMTKCPAGISPGQIESEAARYGRFGKPVFFTTLRYGSLRPLRQGAQEPAQGCALMMTGIAEPRPMREHLKELGFTVSELTFPDHHSFSNDDVMKMAAALEKAGRDAIMITTEKDAARLSAISMPDTLADRTFILPVDAQFVQNGTQFDNMITEHIRNFNR